MTDRDWMILAAGLVAGYVIGRAHAKRLATAADTNTASADPLAWLGEWQCNCRS
jgi:hypothetical protein